MHIMDLVVQGVRRFSQSRKFPLKPGFNVVFGPTESGKSTLVACLLDLLYPDRVRDDEAPFVSWGEVQASRAGLTLGSGGETYRILKDFRSQQISLTQFNRASQKFEPVETDAVQIASFMNSNFDLPSFDIYNRIFVTSADKMPSQLPLTIDEAEKKEKEEVAQLQQSMEQGGGTQVLPGQQPGMQPPGAMPPGFGVPGQQPGAPVPGMPGAAVPGMSAPAVPGMMPGMSGPAMPMPPGAPGYPGQSVPGVMPPGMAGMQPQVDDGLTPEEREEKLKKLREEIVAAEKIEEIQYEIDGLQQEVFDIEHKRKGAEKYDEFINQAREQLEKYLAFRRLPENIDERVDKYKDLHSLQANEIEVVDREAIQYDDEMVDYRTDPPLYKQQLFQLGMGMLIGGIVLFIVGPKIDVAILKTVGMFAALGSVPLLGWTGWQFISRSGKKAELQARLDELEEKRQQIIKRYEVEMAVIEKLMEDSDSNTPEELKGKIEKWRELDERHGTAVDKKRKLEKELDLDSLEREEKKLKGEIEKLEESLRKYPPVSMDINEMRREMKKLEEAIRLTNPNSELLKKEKPPEGPGMGVPNLDSSQGAGTDPGASGATRALKRRPGVRTAPQAYEQLIELSAKLLESERNKLVAHIQERFNLYIQAFFGKRYTEGRFELDGSVALRSAEGGRWVDFESLTPAARDTAYLALQITLIELAIQKLSIPVLLDNPIMRLDETAAAVASKAFKRVGERTQVVLLCGQRGPLQFADHSLHLT